MNQIKEIFKSNISKSVKHTMNSLCNQLELEVINAMVSNYIPGEKFSIDVLLSSSTLKTHCMKMGRFCARTFTFREVLGISIPKSVFADDINKYFDVNNNPDLKIYTLALPSLLNAAYCLVYKEYLILINRPSELAATKRLNDKISKTINICNSQSDIYTYSAYAPMIAVRKACITLNAFINQLNDAKGNIVTLNYGSTAMASRETNIVQRIESWCRA